MYEINLSGRVEQSVSKPTKKRNELQLVVW
jgi:hypothetical protein